MVEYRIFILAKIKSFAQGAVPALSIRGAEPAQAIRGAVPALSIRVFARSARSYCKQKLHSRGISFRSQN